MGTSSGWRTSVSTMTSRQDFLGYDHRKWQGSSSERLPHGIELRCSPVSFPGYQTMGWLRSAVGAGLLLAPNVPMRLAGQEPTAAETLLMRTIGVRDLV